jgi:hypothetical protein
MYVRQSVYAFLSKHVQQMMILVFYRGSGHGSVYRQLGAPHYPFTQMQSRSRTRSVSALARK